MAAVIDNMGRNIEQANMTLGEIKGLISSLMQAKVGPARPVGTDATTGGENVSKLTNLFEQYTKDFSKEVKEQKDLLKEVVQSLKDLNEKRSRKKPEGERKPKKEKTGDSETKAKNFLDRSLKNVGSSFDKLVKDLCACISKMSPTTASPAGGGGGTGGGSGGGSGGGGGGKKGGGKNERSWGGLAIDASLFDMYQILWKIEAQVKKIEDAFMGFNTLPVLIKGMVEEERKFVQQTRQIAYETNNATKETKALNRAYEDQGKTVRQTGFDRDAFQESYIKALKSGVRDLKTANSLVKSQLNTESQLGLKAGDLADEFRNLNMAGRMNVGQIADMGRGMREVARNTGLTGDALKGVISGSKEFIDAMRNAATLTSAAAKNVMEIQANAAKLGIESQMQPLLKAMSSSSDLLMGASSETQALLFRAASSVGRINDLMNGTITRSKAGIKAMAQGVNNVLKEFGVESMEAIDQLSDSAKRDINLRLKAAYGVELGELRSQFEALNEAGKTMADRMADIEKKRQTNLTLEEKAALLEEERRLKTSKSLEVLTALDEAAKGAKNMDQALAKFGERKKEFTEDLAAMGISATDNADIARQSLMSAMDNINAGLKKAGKQELKIDSSEIEKAVKDPTAMRELTAKISKGEQELAVAQKAQLDPMNEMNQTLREINDNIRNFVNAGISGLFNSVLGKILVVVGTIAGLATSLGFMGVNFLSGFNALGKTINRLTGKEDEDGDDKEQTLMQSLTSFLKKKPDESATKAAEDAADKEIQNTNAETKNLKQEKKNTKTESTLLKGEVKAQKGVETPCPSLPGTECFDIEALKQAGGKMLKVAAAIAILAIGVIALGAGIVFLGKKIMSAFNLDMSTVLQTAGIIGAVGLAAGAITAAAIGVFKALESTDASKLADDIKSKAPDLAKIALGIAVLGPALVFLGAAIIKISDLILKGFNLNLSTVGETAAVIAAVAGAAGAVAIGVKEALDAFEEIDVKSLTGKVKNVLPKLPAVALALVLIGPAIVLLGATIIRLSQLVLGAFNLDAKKAAEIGATVAAVIASAGAIALATMAAVGGLVGLGKFAEYMDKFVPEMLLGAAVLMLMAPAITLLASAIVWISKTITGAFGMDPATAAKAAMGISGLIFATGLIALAVMGTSVSLALLGQFAYGIGPAAIGYMTLGAGVLLLMAPAIAGLAAGIIALSNAVISTMIDPAKASETAKAIAGVIGAAADISFSVIGATAALALLGFALSSGLLAGAGVLAFAGAKALLKLTPAIAGLASAMIFMSQKIMKYLVDPNTAKETSEALGSIIKSAASIAWSVLSSTAALALLGLLLPTLAVAGVLMVIGTYALLALTPIVIGIANAIIGMSSALLSLGYNPKQAAEAASGLSSILESAGKISYQIIKLSGMLGSLGLLASIAPYIALSMLLGVGALAILAAPIAAYIAVMVDISKSLGGLLNPKQATEMADGVASIIVSAGKVADQILATSKKLAPLGLLAPFAGYAAILMYMGVASISAISKPIQSFVATIVDFSKKIGGSLNPKQATEMSDGVASIIESASKVADQIIALSPKLAVLGALSPIAGFMALMMWLGVGSLNILKKPVLGFVSTIVNFGQELQSKADPKTVKGVVKGLQNVSTIVSLVSNVLDNLASKIVPLTQAGWISDSPIQQMAAAKDQMNVFFPSIVDFVKSIVTKVGSALGNMKELGVAAKSLRAMAMILSAALPAIQIMSEKIAPLTQGGILWGDSPVEKIKAAIPQFDGFFTQIANFVNSIAQSTKDIQAGPELRDSAKKMRMLSILLAETARAVTSLSVITGMMDGSIFRESPIQKIKRNQFEFAAAFWAIAGLVNYGIVFPINKVIPDGAELQKAACILVALGKVLSGTKVTLESLAAIIGLMEPKSFFSAAPLQSIMDNKDKFSRWFLAIGQFVNEGIVKPVIDEFKTTGEIDSAASIIKSMASIAKNIVPMIENLAKSVSLATDAKSFFGVAPMKQIIDSKGLFSQWFKSIAIFVRDGIVNPVNKEMEGIDIGSAANTITSMAKIAANIVPLIGNLAKAMGLMSDPSGVIDTDFPIDKIMFYKNKFADWFQKIAIFMRDGIVIPILTELPEPKTISLASRILQSMNNVIKLVPQVINGIANGLIPLIYSGDSMMSGETAKEKLAGKTDLFKDWFTSITHFMLDGIVMPILTVLPEGRTIQVASRILAAMGQIVKTLPIVIKNLSSLFVPLDPSNCFAQSPVEVLASNAPKFAEWFRTVTLFIRDGIIDPILFGLPDESDIQAVSDKIKATNTVVGMLPPFLQSLAASIIDLALNTMSFGVMTAMMFAPRLKNLAATLVDGIIGPIQLLPSSEELAEINSQMDELGIVLEKADIVMTTASGKIDKFAQNIFWRFIENWKADQFGARFRNMANALNAGILQPMKLLPSSSEIQEVVKQLDSMVSVLDKVGDVLAAMEQTMATIAESNIDFSGLNKLPLDKIATFASSMKNMSGGGASISGGVAAGGATPSDQAISTRISAQQADSQASVASLMTELINNATRGDGILVRDILTAKNTEALKSAAFNTDMRPAIRVADTRSAMQSMQDSPVEKAQRQDMIERTTRNRYTIRRDQRAEAIRQSREAAGFITQGTTSRVGLARGTGMLDQVSLAKTIGRNAREAQGQQPIGYKLANAAASQQAAGRNAPSIQLAEVAPTIAPNAGDNATVQTAAAPSLAGNIQTAIAQDKAGAMPATVQAVSPELGSLTQEASSQNDKLDTLIELFSKVLQTLQPKSAPSRSSTGGEPPNTKPNEVTGFPPNFYRNTVGLVSQTPAKAALNLSGGTS